MVTSADLKLLTVKELSEIARQWGVTGWHDMRKDDLVRSLVGRARTKTAQTSKMTPAMVAMQVAATRKKLAGSTEKSTAARSAQGVKAADSGVSKSQRPSPAVPATASGSPSQSKKQAPVPRTEPTRRADPRPTGPIGQEKKRGGAERDIRQLKEKFTQSRQIRTVDDRPDHEDRLVLMVRDPYWIHVYWSLCMRTIDRAKVALRHHWHVAQPVLRLFKVVSDGATNPRRQHLRDIPIHGGVDNWYIEVSDPPARFQVEIGYLHQNTQFYKLVTSNIVATPRNQVTDQVNDVDGNWSGVAADFDRVFKLSGGLESHNAALKAVFEEKLRRPMSAPLLSRFGPRPQGNEKTKRNFDFQIDADVVLFGQTDPSVQVSIKGEPLHLNPDGTFSVRFSMPEKRHVFPVDAVGSDGVETQRVIIALERNTKILETLIVEHEEEE